MRTTSSGFSGWASLTVYSPSSSLVTWSPVRTVMPPKLTGTSRSPAPVLPLLRGFDPSALMPRSRVRSTATSRTAPLMTTPAQPLATGAVLEPIGVDVDVDVVAEWVLPTGAPVP